MNKNFKCPFCGKEFEADDAQQPVICPVCSKPVTPEAEPAPEEVKAEPQPEPKAAPQPEPKAAPQPEPKAEPQPQQQAAPKKDVDLFSSGPSGKSRGIAGILAIFLGSLGIHYFYCGKTMPGIVFLLVTLGVGAITCGLGAGVVATIALVQGIMMLVKDQDWFESTYVNTDKSFPLF